MTEAPGAPALMRTLTALQDIAGHVLTAPSEHPDDDIRVEFHADTTDRRLHNTTIAMADACVSYRESRGLEHRFLRVTSIEDEFVCRTCSWEAVSLYGDEGTSFLGSTRDLVTAAQGLLAWLAGPEPEASEACRRALMTAEMLSRKWSAFEELRSSVEQRVDELLETTLLDELCTAAAEEVTAVITRQGEEAAELGLPGAREQYAQIAQQRRADVLAPGWVLLDVPTVHGDADPLLVRLLRSSRLAPRRCLHLLPAKALVPFKLGEKNADLVVRDHLRVTERPDPSALEALGVLYAPGTTGAFTTIESALAAAEVL